MLKIKPLTYKQSRDVIFLSAISFFVFLSLPVSIFDYKNPFEYYFFSKEIHQLEVDIDCLKMSNTCTIIMDPESIIGPESSITVSMSAAVSSIMPLDISVNFGNKLVDGVDVIFRGKSHSHGLHKMAMLKSSSHHFNMKGQLGYCGSGLMDWLADFTVISDGKHYQFSLAFQSIDP